MPAAGQQEQPRARDAGRGGPRQFRRDEPVPGPGCHQHRHADLAQPPGHVPVLARVHERDLARRPRPAGGQPVRGQEHQPQRAVRDQPAAGPGGGPPLAFQFGDPQQLTQALRADPAGRAAHHQAPHGLRMVQRQLQAGDPAARDAHDVHRLPEPLAQRGRVPSGQRGDGHARGRVHRPVDQVDPAPEPAGKRGRGPGR
jgi:hypothetical protein